MKTIVKYLGALLFLGIVACDPLEDRDELPNPIQRSAIKFSVIQQADYDNRVFLENQTPSIIPFWNYGVGESNKQKDTVIVPFAGNHYIKFFAYSGGIPVADSVAITVTQNDTVYFKSIKWKLLTNETAGKTWVWALDHPDGPYGNGAGDAAAPQWWKPGASWVGDEKNEEMTFDLNGSFNFTKNAIKGVEKANFSLDTTTNTLKIFGSDISKGAGITYVVAKLNENELVLAQQGNGWRNLWMFKRKGYSYK